MMKQNSTALNSAINAFGCNFMCHIAMANPYTADAPEIERIYQRALKAGVIDANCFVAKPNELLYLAMLNQNEYCQVGGRSFSTDKAWGVTFDDEKVLYIVNKWQTTEDGYHFTLSSKKGLIYDPYDEATAIYPLHLVKVASQQYYGLRRAI